MPSPSPATPGPSGSAAPSSSSVVTPVALSARRLHELALEAFRVGNRGRLSLCETFRVLSETRLYLDLGFPSLPAYADAFFKLRRAESFEYVRVARALAELTELREAFAQGRIGWSVLKAITRVACVASQASWIDFARENDVERTLAEARDALRRGRDAPRDSSFGLPNLDQKLVLRFSHSDLDRVRTWIEGACASVAASSGIEEVSLEQAILFLCEKDMISDPDPDRSAVDESRSGGRSGCYRAQVVYQHCPDCRKARVGTREGFVEVESVEFERYACCAEPVVIDGPTPPGLRRRVLAREAGRCGNPRCHHRANHCHHIVFRARGGKSELANEVAVCRTCHALIHAGLLRVEGDANGELHWSPVGAEGSLGRRVASERAVAERLPVLQLVSDPTKPPASSGAPEESADADSSAERPGGDRAGVADGGPDLDALAHGLTRLGVPAGRSRRIIGAAVEALPRGGITDAHVLRRALALI